MLPIDLAANAASLGAKVWRANTIAAFRDALAATTGAPGVSVIVVPVDRESQRRRLRLVVERAGRRGLEQRDGARGARGLRRRAAQGARLSVIRVANAPCSWGALEFEADRTARPAVASARRDGRRRIRRHRARRLGISADRTGGACGRRRPPPAGARRGVRAGGAYARRTRSTRGWRERSGRPGC